MLSLAAARRRQAAHDTDKTPFRNQVSAIR
jgi:hypothetical protein